MRTRWILILVVLALLAGLLIFRAARPAATLSVIRPHRGAIRAYVQELATTRLPQDYLIAMPIPGWLNPIDLREGDPVRKGQVIATLDTADLKDRVKQVEERIAALRAHIAKVSDDAMENDALVQAEAVVKAMDETVKAAEAKLLASKAVADFAREEVDRFQKLAKGNAIAERDLHAAETNWRKASADYQGDQLNLVALKTLDAVSYVTPKLIRDYIAKKQYDKQAYERQLLEATAALQIENRNLERATIASPIDGIVLQRHETRHQYLQPGTPLLTLGNLDTLEVVAEVLTERAMHVSPGDPVEITGEGLPDGPIAGKVLRVYPAGFKKISSLGVEQQRVDVTIAPEKRPPTLGVNYRVEVRIFYGNVQDALVLPRTSLFRGAQGDWMVMVVRRGYTELQPVQVGLMNDDEVQVLQGLSADEAVVARPSREIEPGMRVAVTQAR
jgi:HlyD family secretion protein